MILIGEGIPAADIKDLDFFLALIILEMIELTDLKRELHRFAQSGDVS